MSSALDRFSKWLQLKIYQLEVTFGVYIFTPAEKFIFYSFFFLLFSLIVLATIVYLPQHVQFIMSRTWFYMHGDAHDAAAAAATKAAVTHLLAHSSTGALGTAAASVGEATASVLKEL